MAVTSHTVLTVNWTEVVIAQFGLHKDQYITFTISNKCKTAVFLNPSFLRKIKYNPEAKKINEKEMEWSYSSLSLLMCHLSTGFKQSEPT